MPDPLGPSEALLAADVARRYYLVGESKVELAQALGISRFKVARLLEAAREHGIVRIEIVSPSDIDTGLSTELAAAMGLDHCIVVPGRSAHAEPGVDQAAASLLTEVVGERDVLGLPWSRSVDQMVSALTSLPSIPVVQLSGAMVSADEDRTSVDVVRRAARIARGDRHVFYAPLVVNDAASAAVMRCQPAVRSALAQVNTVTVAVVGLGAWAPGLSTIHDATSQRDRRTVSKAGVVGECAGVLFDENGSTVETPLTERMVTLSGRQLRGIPQVLAIAHGPGKVPAIAAAARGRLITSLVTTAETAELLLRP